MKQPRWLSETVYHDSDGFFADLVSAIDKAQETIDFEMYIFENDALGQRIIEAFIRAAQRGVRVRLLIDGLGSPFWRFHFAKRLKAVGISARIYHPYPWAFFSFPFGIRRIGRLFARVNKRNHRKVCLIDRKEAWVGSMNVWAVHLSEFNEKRSWRDTGVRIRGKELRKLAGVFNLAWSRAWYLAPFKGRMQKRKSVSSLVFLNHQTWMRHRHLRNLITRIDKAKERLWITNAYFVPPRALLRALKRAAERGVDVRLILPQAPDVRLVKWAASAFYGTLLHSGVRIFEYHTSVLHAKTMIIDDWATVGTSNLDTRSFRHNFEVAIVMTHESSLLSLSRQFSQDVEHAQGVSLQAWTQRPRMQRIAERLVMLIRYWI